MSTPQASSARYVTLVAAVAFIGFQAWQSPLAPALVGISARGPTPGLEDEPFFPPPDPTIDATLAGARAILSARLAEEEPPAVVPGLAPDRECLLSLYVPQGKGRSGPYVADLDASAIDAGLLAAVEDIHDQLREMDPGAEAIAASRFKIDCVVGGERAFPRDGGHKGIALDQGLDGIVLRTEGREPFRWLPSWAIEKPVARRHMHRSARRMARSLARWKKKEANEATFAAFRTRAYVEDPSHSGPALPLVRANTDAPALAPAELRLAITEAGEYLTRETDARGKLTYHYDDRKDRVERGYNLLRHAGSTYSMLQAYRISGDPEVLEASERAIGYFRRAMREDEKHPGEWFAVEGRRAKLGAIGLGLLMFVEHAKVAPERAYDIELLRGMGRHIERMMLPSGELVSFYNWDGKERSTRKSIFYSGEAILGLIRLHQLTGEQRWLDVATKAADFLVHKRWVALGIRLYIPPDAWLLQALEEMDRVAPDAARADYAFKLGHSIAQLKLVDVDKTPPDLLGGEKSSLANLPPTATSGSFGEALSACARLEARRRPDTTDCRDVAALNARYQLRAQLRPDNTYYLSNPDRARGGWRKRMASGEVRNDHVQHNLSGLFGILPLYDETAPDIGLFVAETK